MSRPKFVFATPIPGHFLVSPNMQCMPPIPLQEIPHEFDDNPLPSDTRSLRLSHNKYPFLGFVVKNVQWKGALLERLRLPSRVPIELENDKFIFNKDLTHRWQRLEIGLAGLVQAVGDHFQLTFPVDVGVFPGPSSHGYMGSRSSHKHMLTAVFRAHNTFVPLMVMCSYVITMTPKAHTENAPWMKALMDKGVVAQWVQDLKQSPVGTFSPEHERVGVGVHQDCHFPKQIPSFVEAGVPVWIYFAQKPTPDKLCYGGTILRNFHLPSPLEYT
ncbi:hypothetical protein FIBSPDRAFT_948323 [Athelia psychrophila]|uniref:Uncharacterized protein n=1 Tax=Athelia psychrophila TaxID=1759441 RepID=A0A166QZW6_9AGAM|nr:hypothetical protein FIBSPDRAFT_948323 [Fibularhizoctonia sp. CBS 109695]